jgi:hypothetical protein
VNYVGKFLHTAKNSYKKIILAALSIHHPRITVTARNKKLADDTRKFSFSSIAPLFGNRRRNNCKEDQDGQID